MTLRDVDLAVRKISIRRHNNYVQKAALQGIKLQPIGISKDDPAVTEFTPEQKQLAEQAMEEILARPRKRQR